MRIRLGVLLAAVLATVVVTPGDGTGQTTYTWNFGTTAANAQPSSASGNSNLTITDFTVGNSLGTVSTPIGNQTVSSGYAGASGAYNIGNATKTGALDPTTSSYISFTVTPTGGNTAVSLSNLSFGSRSTSTGPIAIALRSSTDGFAADITTTAVSASSAWTLQNPTLPTNSFTATSGQPIEFRFYGYGGGGNANNNTINWKIDDVTLTITPVPEPATVGLVGAAVLGGGAFVRRKLFKPVSAAV